MSVLGRRFIETDKIWVLNYLRKLVHHDNFHGIESSGILFVISGKEVVVTYLKKSLLGKFPIFFCFVLLGWGLTDALSTHICRLCSVEWDKKMDLLNGDFEGKRLSL